MEQALKDKLTAGGVDVAQTLARFGGNENLYMKYMRRFPTDPTMGKLEALMQTTDRAQIKAITHTLKGLSGNLGLAPLYEATSAMMTRLRESDDADATAEYERVKTAYQQALELTKDL